MNNDAAWQALLARSTSTFNGDTAPPYGFVTSMTSRLRAERGQVADIERIGWRAIWASVGVLAVSIAITVGVNLHDRGNELDPGVRSVVQVENLSIS